MTEEIFFKKKLHAKQRGILKMTTNQAILTTNHRMTQLRASTKDPNEHDDSRHDVDNNPSCRSIPQGDDTSED